MTPELRAYLRVTTCLLPRSERQNVRAELHGNLHQAMLDAMLAGRTEADAWAQVLREAGPAWLGAVNFARAYYAGLVGRGVLVAALLGGATYAVQVSGTHTEVDVSVHHASPNTATSQGRP